jgi:hypothetical protein
MGSANSHQLTRKGKSVAILTVGIDTAKNESCPTRYEPGGGRDIPLRSEPGGGLGLAVWGLAGSPPTVRVDHRLDGDRHERSPSAHARASAPGAGGYTGDGVPGGCRRQGSVCVDRGRSRAPRVPPATPPRPRPCAGLPAAPERLQPGPDHAAGFTLGRGQAAGQELRPAASPVCPPVHACGRGAAGRCRPRHGHVVGPGHGLRAAPPAGRLW